MLDSRRFSPRLVVFASITATLVTACVPIGGKGTRATDDTAWLRHIEARPVQRTEPKSAQLISELRFAALESHHTRAEQLAAHAVQELQNGREWDAGLFLAMASYRYHQQAMLALRLGRQQEHRVRLSARGMFHDYMRQEIRTFNNLHFDDELRLLRRHLFGIAAVSERVDAYRNGLTSASATAAALVPRLEDFKVAMSNREEELEHQALADAFLARLRADHQSDDKDSFAFYYLAATPLDRFRLAALDDVKAPFSSILVSNTVPRIQTLRNQVRRRIGAARASTRANAAAILGMGRDPADIPLLEERFAGEDDDLVRNSLRFALAWHGREEHLQELSARALTDHHALTLLAWLPSDMVSQLDERSFVRLARGLAGGTIELRRRALDVVFAISRQRELAPESIQAVLELVPTPDELTAELASDIVEQLAQLDAAACQELYQRYPKARAALLFRMTRVASHDDLAFLERAYAENDDAASKFAAMGAIASVPGSTSRRSLETILIEAASDDILQGHAVALLASRPDADATRLLASELAPAERLLVELAFGTRDMTSSEFGAALRRMSVLEAGQIALLAKTAYHPGLHDPLWQLSSYRDNEHYPADAVVRQVAMSALFREGLDRRIRRLSRTDALRDDTTRRSEQP